MEWHRLDHLLQRKDVIEGFESFIWTERYAAWGDFQIVTRATPENRSLLAIGSRIGMNESCRVMKIESVEEAVDDDGKRMLTVTGRSIESWLDDRIAMPMLDDLTAMPKWIMTGTPAGIVRSMFKSVCVDGVMSVNDTLDFFQDGDFIPAGTIAEPAEILTIEFEPATLYNNIKQVCEMWMLGFRLVKDGDTGKIYFAVYTGDDRTSNQTTRRAIIFSQVLESIGKTAWLRSNAALKNVAYVLAKNSALEVYADGIVPPLSGSSRRIMVVSAEDLDLPAGDDLNAAMTVRGRQELAKNREVYALDGEMPQYIPYEYGYDYNLGDLVEERTAEGFSNFMIVTEQIFVSDEQGERAYPTLTLSSYVTPGSWDAELATEHWEDVDITIHWGDR